MGILGTHLTSQPRVGRRKTLATAGQRLLVQQELEVGALPKDKEEQRGPRNAQRKHTL